MNKLYKIAIGCLTMLFTSSLFAQLYVGPNSYVYANDRMIYVKQNVSLQNTGNFYLRNQSQLLQATTGTSTNAGAGKLSVFQEGTVDNFEYNYWCSPVGNASATTGNEPFGITMLNTPTSLTASTPAVMLSTSALDGVASPLSIAPRWIFKFLSSINYSNWISVGSASTIGAGEGFTMKGTSGTDTSFSEGGVTNNPGSAQRYDFRGKANDGSISISVAAGKRTLTGNPYPSAIDLQQFLLTATNPSAANCTGSAYFWEQDKSVNSHFIAAYQGGYGTYAAGSNIYTPPTFYAYDGSGTQLSAIGTGGNYPRKFSPIGQGFMIEGTANSTVNMQNIFRVYVKEGATSHFDRNAGDSAMFNEGDFLPAIPSVSGFDYTTESTAPTPQIRFNTLLDNQGIRQVALAFLPNATDGVDHAMDAKSPGGGPVDMFFALDNNEYVIEAVAFDVNKKIPVGFKCESAAFFKITVSEMLNFDTENVFLHDKISNVYHNIKNAEFEMFLQAGANTDQYEITFVNDALGVSGNTASDDFDVFQNNGSQLLTVANPKRIAIKSVAMYDVAGRLIFEKVKLGPSDSYQFPTIGISDAAYIVKITTSDNQNFAKKITVFNRN